MKKYEVRNLKDCVLDANLRFGNSRIVEDLTHLHNTGIITSAKRNRQRMDFDGSNDRIRIANDDSLNKSDNLSIEALFRSKENGTFQGIVTKMYNSQKAGYSISKRSDNKITYMIGNIIGYELIQSDVAYTDQDLHHVVGVTRNGTHYLFVDGVEQAATGTNNIVTNTQDLIVGRYYSDVYSYYLKGEIFEAKFYGRGLSAEEVKKAYMDARLRYMNNLILPK